MLNQRGQLMAENTETILSWLGSRLCSTEQSTNSIIVLLEFQSVLGSEDNIKGRGCRKYINTSQKQSSSLCPKQLMEGNVEYHPLFPPKQWTYIVYPEPETIMLKQPGYYYFV